MSKRRQFLAGCARSGGRFGILISIFMLGFLGLRCHELGAAENEAMPALTGAYSSQRVASLYARLPLSFELNRGQFDPRVNFVARGLGYTLFLTPREAVLALRGSSPVNSSSYAGTRAAELLAAPDEHQALASTTVRLKFVGANGKSGSVALDRQSGQSNYFLGNDPKNWRTNVPSYAKVKYEGVYPGVDLIYYGNQGQLEYDFVVAPGADPRAIRFALTSPRGPCGSARPGEPGARVLRIDSGGDLVVQTGDGEVRFRKPVVYQPSARNGKSDSKNRQLRSGRFVMMADNSIGFAIASYDRTRPLIIDPVLSYSTYLGGSGGDVAFGVAVDSGGNAYVTGSTGSPNFPTRLAEQDAYAGGVDVFVTKFSASGSALVYSTYIGGAQLDSASGISVDSTGSAYIVGRTYSTNFPTSPDAFQLIAGGNGDAFVAKLDPLGSQLVYSSYLGGSSTDAGQAIAVDSSGNAYVTGSTQSIDFPTVNPMQIGNDGSLDLFLAKVNPSGTGLTYSTYLGGSSADFGQAIALDSSGNTYVAGYTLSTNFPTQNALQASSAGGGDVFITEMNAAGTGLVFSTYLGGKALDRAFGLVLDSSGNMYITGDTQSADFPTTPNAFQTSNRGQGDGFVCKVAAGGSNLVYSTLLGGSGVDQATGIAVSASGNAYVTGLTQSTDFPIAQPLQTLLNSSGGGTCGLTLCPDAFISELGPSGAILSSTYLGGSGEDYAQAIALDSSSAVYVVGATRSPNFPVIAGAPQGTFAGTALNSNAFLAKIIDIAAPGVALSPQQLNFGNQGLNTASTPRTISLTNAGSAPLEIASIDSSSPEFTETNNCGNLVPAGGGSCAIQVTFTPTATGSSTNQISISDNAQGSPQIVTVTGNGVTSAGLLTPSPKSLTFPAASVGVTSSPLLAYLINTGNTSVTITNIIITGDFAQTNSCGALPSVLNVGESCAFSVTFTPTGSGLRAGGISITDDAGNSPQGISLQGTGNALFTLSASVRSTALVIGTTSTTFTVSASAASTFINSITLSCSTGATCAFDPASITAGESSTLTVSQLSSTSPNPTNFTVTGTSGSQSTSLGLSIFFADFSVGAAPALNTITAGKSATYTVTVTPTNGFNQVVLLDCSNLPQETTCTWSPPAVTLDGRTLATAKVTVKTTSQTAHLTHRPPPGDWRVGPALGRVRPLLWLLVCGLLAISAWVGGTRNRLWDKPQMILRLAALSGLLCLLGMFMGCNDYGYYPGITPATTTGTPTGVYTIVVTGTLGNNSSVTRTTTFNLSVGAG